MLKNAVPAETLFSALVRSLTSRSGGVLQVGLTSQESEPWAGPSSEARRRAALSARG